jgi:hypothetical protein
VDWRGQVGGGWGIRIERVPNLSARDNQRLPCMRRRIELSPVRRGLRSGLRARRVELVARGGVCGGDGETDGIAVGGSGLLAAASNGLRRPHPNPAENLTAARNPEVGRAGMAGGVGWG